MIIRRAGGIAMIMAAVGTSSPVAGQGLTHHWSHGYGLDHPNIPEQGWGIAADAEGNFAAIGFYLGSVSVGGDPLPSQGLGSIFVAKYAPDGTHVWSRGFTSNWEAGGYDIDVDPDGNIIATGYFFDTVDFGGGPFTAAGDADVFLAKYAPDGTHLWSRAFGGGSSDIGQAVAADVDGNIILSGRFYSSATFGGDPLASEGYHDVFLAKYAPDGSHVWSQRFGGTGYDSALAVAVDGAGNIATTGFFHETAMFGGEPITASGREDIFIARYAPDGTHLWSRGFGGSPTTYRGELGHDIDAHSDGSIVVTGRFQGTADFGGGPIASAGGADAFVAKFGLDGLHHWSHGFGGEYDDLGSGVAVLGTGEVIATGLFYGTVSLGGPLIDDGTMYLARFSTTGAHRWSRGIGGQTSSIEAFDLAVVDSGNVAVTGGFWGAADFGGGPILAAGYGDIFIAGYAPYCIGDLNGDGRADVSDLLVLLGYWGPCSPGVLCLGDISGDGTVEVSDLLLLLAAWGPCP